MKNILRLIIVAISLPLITSAQEKFATISGTGSHLKDGEKIVLTTLKYGSIFRPEGSHYDTVTVHHNNFNFRIPMTQKSEEIWISSIDGQQSIIEQLYIHPKDKITLKYEKNNTLFTGKNALRFALQMRIRRLLTSNQTPFNVQSLDSYLSYFKSVDSFQMKSLLLLEAHKKALSKSDFNLIQTIVIAGNEMSKLGYLRFHFYGYDTTKAVEESTAVANYFKHDSYAIALEKGFIPSLDFCNYALLPYFRYQNDSCFLKGKPLNLQECYDYFATHYRDELGDKLIAYFLFSHRQSTYEQYDKLVNQGLAKVKDPAMHQIIADLAHSHIKGSTVQNFALEDSLGRMHNLSDFKGKIVVIDFWFTGCGNCAQLTPYLKKVEDRFKENNKVVFISISSDKDSKMWKESLKKGIYTSDNGGVNLYTGKLGDQHPFYKSLGVNSAPTLIMIDKQGKLMTNPKDCREDDGKDLIAKIESGLKN